LVCIWATNVLRKHLVDGYTINEKRLKAQQNKINELQEAMRLLGNIALLEDVSDEAKGIMSDMSSIGQVNLPTTLENRNAGAKR